jgi:hypothetical protein
MLMTIRYQSGLRVEAVVLAANRERMRVAIDSESDTMELHVVDAGWHTEDGAEIEIELKVVEVSERVGRGGQSEEVGAHQLAWRNGEA